MNKVINIGIAVITSFFFLGCSTSKTTLDGFQSNPPFKVLEATYTELVDEKSGVNGISIYISIDNAEVKLDSVYFRNNSAKLKLDKDISKTEYIGSLVMPNKDNDLQLNIDSKKEFGNRVPDISQKIPFKLKANEAVVSYFFKNKRNYFKISDCIETTIE